MKNKKIIIMVVGILVLLLAVATATHAWFSATSKAEEKNITTAKEELIVAPTKDPIHIENIKPTRVTNSPSFGIDPVQATDRNNQNDDAVSIPISVTNKSTININYNLTIKTANLNLKEGLNGGTTDDVRWMLFKLPSENGSSSDIVGFGDFYDPKVEQNMIENIEIKPEEKHYYMLYVYIQEMEEDQNRLQNIEFDVVINGNTKKRQIPVGEKLSDVLLKNDIIKDRKPNYKTVKCYDKYSNCLTDNGLYKLENGKGYIYRNFAVKNSFIYFGRYKANDNLLNIDKSKEKIPIPWQILRINEDGSVVLILTPLLTSFPKYGEKPSKFSWETTSGKADYDGSNIQKALNEWYDHIFTDKEKEMIKTTTYCNDRSDNYEGVSNRLKKEIPEPTLECEEKDKVTANIALPTADELVMAGNYYINKWINSSYADNYEYGFGALTMSPASQEKVYNMSILTSSYITPSNLPDVDKVINPVITLKPDATVLESVTWNDEIYKTSFGRFTNIYVVGYDE